MNLAVVKALINFLISDRKLNFSWRRQEVEQMNQRFSHQEKIVNYKRLIYDKLRQLMTELSKGSRSRWKKDLKTLARQ